MSHDAFELMERRPIATLRVVLECYRHRVTGARHYHLAAQDPNNAFLTAFLTVPNDDTGVAHILEHTALCGSERYPVRDPFFMMLRRSLATFMNAFTSSDWTAYPFASQSEKDFFNLLNVYLDAAFFPNLAELDFAQEGCRVEFATPGDTASELVYKGVVFNEMKGAMSSPSRVLWQELMRHLFPNITYHYNSGGEPERIPDLTWEGLRAFHSRHYHPSNALFMTYGTIPAATHQAIFEERVLSKFQRLDTVFSVPAEERLAAPLRVEERYSVEGETTAKTHVVLGWLWGRAFELEELLEAHLLSAILLDNSSSPLLHALETSELGNSPSPICGLDDSGREMVFVCGLEGSEPEHADAIEGMILEVLEQVATHGVEPERVAAVLHQLELRRREVSGGGYPYGLKLMLDILPTALHGGSPAAILDLDPVLERLQREVQDPDYVKRLARKWLLDNPHRVRLTLRPDTALNEERRNQELARLAALKSSLSREAQDQLVERSAALEERQNQPDNPDILPKVDLADVPADLPIPEGRWEQSATLPIAWYDRPTNGLIYHQVALELPELPPAVMDQLPLFVSVLTEVGCGDRNYMDNQAWHSAISGGVGASIAARGVVDNSTEMRCSMRITSKALLRNQKHLARLVQETLCQSRFDELARIRELIAQMRAGAEERIPDQGHSLAISAAAAGLSPIAALNERWGGMSFIKNIKTLDKSLDDQHQLQRFANELRQIAEQMATAPRQLLVVGEEKIFAEFANHINTCWSAAPGTIQRPALAHRSDSQQLAIGWAAETQVNFCARVHPAVHYSHPDAPALVVLGPFLRNGYLHRAIREQGGAYGSGASFDSDSSTFRFHSYRDPRLYETFQEFERSVEWLLEKDHPFQPLEEAILGVIASIDRPGSPAGEAIQAFHDTLNGRTPALRRAFRSRILEVTVAELQQVAKRYLKPETANLAVVSNQGTLAGQQDLALEIRAL